MLFLPALHSQSLHPQGSALSRVHITASLFPVSLSGSYPTECCMLLYTASGLRNCSRICISVFRFCLRSAYASSVLSVRNGPALQPTALSAIRYTAAVFLQMISDFDRYGTEIAFQTVHITDQCIADPFGFSEDTADRLLLFAVQLV